MIHNRFNMFLRAPEAEKPGGGAAAPEKQAAPENGGADNQQAQPNAPPEKQEGGQQQPSIIQKVAAAMKDKGSLLAERDAAVTRAETAEAQVKTLQGQLATANAELGRLTKERADIEAALNGEQAKNTTVEKQAAAIVARETGVDTAELPDRQQEGNAIAALYAQLDACTDPKEITRISRKIDAAEAKALKGDD